MATLKKMTCYRLRNPKSKNKKYVDEIIPIEDREVSVEVFNQYEEVVK
jgi:hypothetical protein